MSLLPKFAFTALLLSIVPVSSPETSRPARFQRVHSETIRPLPAPYVKQATAGEVVGLRKRGNRVVFYGFDRDWLYFAAYRPIFPGCSWRALANPKYRLGSQLLVARSQAAEADLGPYFHLPE